MIEDFDGSLFEAPVGTILHSCNCFHTMGAGIAKQIKLKYPRAYEVDLLTQYGSPNKLGQFSVSVPAEDQPFYILNCYTQHRYGRDKQYVEYDKFHECMENVREWIYRMGIEDEALGIPYLISCNNAGGVWTKIRSILNYHFAKDKLKVLICHLQ